MNLDTLYKQNFKVEEKIAKGGFATIFRAIHATTGNEVAIKIGRLFDDPGYAKALREEARILSRLSHENVVKLLPLSRPGKTAVSYARALDLSGRPYFFVMEYLAGGTLEEYLEQVDKLTVPEAAAIALEVARGLRYVHKRGYAHNDLKLENIVFRTPVRVGEPFMPVLVDFGIATRVKLQTEAGSPYVMAPEQLSQAQWLSPPEVVTGVDPTKVDVWGLGILLYRMLGGRLPFEGRTEKRITDRILTTRPASLKRLSNDVPPEIDDLILDGCLAKKPNNRLDLVSLGKQLSNIAGDTTAQTVPSQRSGWFSW